MSAVIIPRTVAHRELPADDVAVGLNDLPLPALRVQGTAVMAVNRLAEGLLDALLATAGLPSLLGDAAGPSSVRLRSGGVERVVQVFRNVDDGGALVLLHDVTAERSLINALAESRSRLNDFVRCSVDFAWETDASGRFAYVSPKGALGRPAREVAGRPVLDFLRHWRGGEASPFESRSPCEAVEVRLALAADEIGIFEVSAVPCYDEAGLWQGARGVCRDVTEARRQAEALRRATDRLQEMARIDPLTGALNRRAFFEDLSVRLAQARRHGDRGLLLYLDLDSFKAVNDGYGHAAGDAVLRQVAEVLRENVRETDLVGRIGGDEFVVWLDRVGTVDQGERIAALKTAIAGAGCDYPAAGGFGASIGVVGTDGEVDPEELIVAADAAMYAAKRARKEQGGG
ncbi:diguanylate cyclase [Desertibaculum subflavum]|uniref:diguanylate cyclase n=1 Tax=Desertibaculum subflavum TaxID=2268458 RepID=UPI000E66ED86